MTKFQIRQPALLLFILFTFSYQAYSQGIKNKGVGNAKITVHPRIYCTDAAKADFLQSVKQVPWKELIIENKKESLERYLSLCAADPDWLVSRLQMNWKTKHNKVLLRGGSFSHSEGTAPVPTVRFSGSRDWATDYMSPSLDEVEPYFDDERGMYLKKKSTEEKEWVHPSKTGHIIEGINSRIMNLVGDAAFLYWLTGEEKYAEFAIPVYTQYMEGMYHREAPYDLTDSAQQRLSGLATFEVIHEGIVIPLTLTYDFLFNYFKESGYDLDLSVEVFQRWGDQIIKNGVGSNNWNFFQARFLTYIALALDENVNYKNGKGQEYYLEQTFDVTTERQIALREASLNYDQETGIWPESDGISRGTAPAEMMGQKIPTLVLRRNEEAWNNPFTVILNPYIEGENQIISNVDFLESDSRTGIQMVKVEHSDGTTEDLIIATTSENDILEKDEIYFQGLLAIQRESEKQLEFIFASGLRRFSHSGWEILSRTENVTISIERNETGFTIQNDKPVSIRVPNELNPAYLEIYKEGKVIGKRTGVLRDRSNQVEFKLEKPFEKAVIVVTEL